MKKRTGLLLVLCLLIAGCAVPGEEAPSNGPYVDGIYRVQMPEYQNGWLEYGQLTVENGFVVAVEYDGENEAGNKKSADEAYRDEMAAASVIQGMEAIYPQKVYDVLLTRLGKGGGDPMEVELIAGATASSQNFKRIMRQLKEMLKAGQPGVQTIPLYQDGVYQVEMPDFVEDWRDYVRITVENGSISAVEFDAWDEDGALRSADEEYKGEMIAGNQKEDLPETYPADYGKKLADGLVSAGDLDGVDGVAGATRSSRTFQKLAERGLANAKSGKEPTAVAPLFEDGSFGARMAEADEDGWTEFVALTIRGNAITSVAFDAVDQNGGYLSRDEAYRAQAAEEGNPDPAEVYPAIIRAYIDAGYLLDDMEEVSGAGDSLENFRKLIVAALEQAFYGDDETVLVQ